MAMKTIRKQQLQILGHWMRKDGMEELHSFFVGIPNYFRASIFFNFSAFEPRFILNLFLNASSLTLLKNLRNIFRTSLMFYYIL